MAKLRWRIKGFRELRLAPGVIEDLGRRADAVRADAGDGYESSTFEGRNRGRASVITVTADAMRDNARNQSLLRALDAGR